MTREQSSLEPLDPEAVHVANVLSWLWADVLYAVGLLVVAFALVGVPIV